MGRREDLRLAQPMPSTGQGLGEINRLRTGMDSCRQHPTPHKAARKVLLSNIEFRVGLLEVTEVAPHCVVLAEIGQRGRGPLEVRVFG